MAFKKRQVNRDWKLILKLTLYGIDIYIIDCEIVSKIVWDVIKSKSQSITVRMENIFISKLLTTQCLHQNANQDVLLEIQNEYQQKFGPLSFVNFLVLFSRLFFVSKWSSITQLSVRKLSSCTVIVSFTSN